MEEERLSAYDVMMVGEEGGGGARGGGGGLHRGSDLAPFQAGSPS